MLMGDEKKEQYAAGRAFNFARISVNGHDMNWVAFDRQRVALRFREVMRL